MYCGIDIGTSSIKVVLIDEAQKVAATASADLTVQRPQPGWSEQNPEAWIAACDAVMAELRRTAPEAMAKVTGIGLSGQQHGATLIDADDEPLRPCILWNDARSGEECAELEAEEPAFRTVGGNRVMAGFTAPKLRWVEKNEPGIFARVAKVLLPKDYVRLWLIGDHVAEQSDAGSTLWHDVANRKWAPKLLEATHLTMDHMPRLVEGTEVSGSLRAELATAWGMGSGVVVAGGGGDNAASACGVGVVPAGSALLSIGTSGVLFVSNARFSPNTDGGVHAMCHAIPGLWHQMGVILSAANSLAWLSSVTRIPAGELAGMIPEAPRAPSALTFLPYLSGERTPHADPDIRGAIVGIDAATETADLVQAVFEGVAFAFRDNDEALVAAGTKVARATAVGGGSRSRPWLQIMATLLGYPIGIPEEGDFGGAYGAARLGQCAATGGDPLEICSQPTIIASIEPDPALVDAYSEAFTRYKALYPALKSIN